MSETLDLAREDYDPAVAVLIRFARITRAAALVSDGEE